MPDSARDADRLHGRGPLDLGGWVGLGGLVFIALGALLPWSEADVLFFHLTAKGTDGDGVITLVAVGVGVALFGLVKTRAARGLLLVLAAVTSGAVALYNAVNLEHTARQLAGSPIPVHTRAGIGLWLTGIGAVLALSGGLLLLIEARRAAKT